MKKNIAIFGGSFNPPLNSHFLLAQNILNEFENMEKVVFLPVSSMYPKDGLVAHRHRYNMLKLVCDKNENFEVSDVELKQDRQLSSFETLEILQKEYPENELFFVIGTDNLREIPTWSYAKELLTNFKILVLARDEDNIEEIMKSDEFLITYKDAFVSLKENIRTNMSSTFARKEIKKGKSIRYLTPDEVYYYIKENELY